MGIDLGENLSVEQRAVLVRRALTARQLQGVDDARNRHDARFFVRQIDLIRWARPLNRRLGRLAARLSA
jgi:hypothetical protein